MNIEMLSGISIVLVQSLGFVGDFKSIHLITLVSHHDNDKLEREVKTWLLFDEQFQVQNLRWWHFNKTISNISPVQWLFYPERRNRILQLHKIDRNHFQLLICDAMPDSFVIHWYIFFEMFPGSKIYLQNLITSEINCAVNMQSQHCF